MRDERLRPVFLDHTRELAFIYHGRWAVSFTPLVCMMLGLSTATRRSRWPRAIGVAACCAYLGYYVFFFGFDALARDVRVPVFVAAWMPNIALALVAFATRAMWRRPVQFAR